MPNERPWRDRETLKRLHHDEEDGREENAANVPDSALVALCPSCHISVEVNGYELD